MEGTVMKRFAIYLLFAVLAAAAAQADPVTEHLDNDAELVAALTDTLFVAEGRGGDGAGVATFELDLGPDSGAPAATAQYGWVSGQPEPFSITYDAGNGDIEFTLGGEVLSYSTPYPEFGDMFIRTRAVDDGSAVVVDDLVLDGFAIMDQSSAASPGGGLDILWIKQAELSDGFTLTGTATLTWTDTLPGQSRLAFQVKTARLGAVDNATASWGSWKASFR
jgi:hypothetical protein